MIPDPNIANVVPPVGDRVESPGVKVEVYLVDTSSVDRPSRVRIVA